MGIKLQLLKASHYVDGFVHAHPLRATLVFMVIFLWIRAFIDSSNIKKLEREVFDLKLKLK
jgi:hypothetical protein